MTKLDKLLPKIKKALRKYPLVLVYVFGSYAKRQVGPLSDLDLAVYFDVKEVKPKNTQQLSDDIKEELEIALGMREKVDVVALGDIPPLLEKEIVYQGKLIINKNDNIRARYESAAVGRWLDWKWYQDQFDQAIEKELGTKVRINQLAFT